MSFRLYCKKCFFTNWSLTIQLSPVLQQLPLFYYHTPIPRHVKPNDCIFLKEKESAIYLFFSAYMSSEMHKYMIDLLSWFLVRDGWGTYLKCPYNLDTFLEIVPFQITLS